MRIAALALLALLAGSSTAAQPPPASDRQVLERATALRREATSLRAHADREEERRKPECHAAFQVNRCLKDAREAKLAEVRRARALERQAHQLELGVKRRQAAISAPASAERSLTPTTAAPPLRIKARTEQPVSKTTPGDTAASRRAHAAQDAARRSAAQAAAARRAAQAKADRERYDTRLRSYEEKQSTGKAAQ